MRRSLVVLVLLLILGGIGWWLFRWNSERGERGDPWSAIPSGMAVLVEFPQPLTAWTRFTGTAQLWRAMERMPACTALNAVLTRIGAAASTNEALRRALDDAPLLVALPPGDAGGVLMAWSLTAPTAELATLGPALQADLGSGSPLWNEGIITFRPDTGLPELHATWSRGLLLVSTRTDLLEDARQRSRSAGVDSTLLRARATLGVGADAHVLVQPGSAARLLARWLDPAVLGDFTVPEGWAALDVRLRPETILLSGLLFTDSPTPGLAAIAEQTPTRSSITRVLPARTNWLRATTISDPGRFFIASQAAPELITAYASWVNGTVGQASAFTLGDSVPARWAVIRCEDPGTAMRALMERCPNGRCDTTAYRGVRVVQSADTGALEAVYGPAFRPFARPLWALMGDKMVFTGHPAWMREAVDAWIDGTSLALDPRSGRFFQRYASDAGITWWADGARSFAPLRTMARPATVEGMDRWFKVWQALGGCLLEVSPERNGIYQITLSLQHAPLDQQEANALWTASIGTPAAQRPWLLKDHLSRTQLVLNQGTDQRISLISCTGKVLWQRELDGPILGEVHQVDRYRNGKLQMLFNTADRVHIIDRNGKDVEGFPVLLTEKAAAPLSVFDYEGNKEYRVIVPTTSGRLLNYSLDGTPVQGWSPATLSAPAVAPVEHFRIKGKDVLVAACTDGTMVVLDRRGEKRYDVQGRMQRMAGFQGLREGSDVGSSRAFWTDSAGTVLSVTFDGALDTLAAAEGGHVLVADLDGDGLEEVVRTRRDSLRVSNKQGERSTAFLPESNEESTFIVALPDGRTGIGAVWPVREQLRLYASDGALWPGFPLRGATAFRVADINLDGVLELITATNDGNVIVYPLAAPAP